MFNSQATLESFDCAEVKLPNGRVVECRVLSIRESLRFMRLLADSRKEGDESLFRLLEEFPAAVELDPDIPLTPAEVIDLVECFFAHRRAPTEKLRPTLMTPLGSTGSTT